MKENLEGKKLHINCVYEIGDKVKYHELRDMLEAIAAKDVGDEHYMLRMHGDFLSAVNTAILQAKCGSDLDVEGVITNTLRLSITGEMPIPGKAFPVYKVVEQINAWFEQEPSDAEDAYFPILTEPCAMIMNELNEMAAHNENESGIADMSDDDILKEALDILNGN